MVRSRRCPCARRSVALPGIASCLVGDLSGRRVGTSKTVFVTVGRARIGSRFHSTSKVCSPLVSSVSVPSYRLSYCRPSVLVCRSLATRKWLYYLGYGQDLPSKLATQLGLTQVMEQHGEPQRCLLRQGTAQRVSDAQSQPTY